MKRDPENKFDEFRAKQDDGTNSIQQRITSVDDVPARSRGARSVSVARVPLLPANHIRQNAHLYLDPPDRAHSLPCHDPLYRRPIVIDVLEIELQLTTTRKISSLRGSPDDRSCTRRECKHVWNEMKEERISWTSWKCGNLKRLCPLSAN